MIQRLVDDIYPSADLCTPEGGEFLRCISTVELLQDSILTLTAPNLYSSAQGAIYDLKQAAASHPQHANVDLWPSSLSGLQVIVNRSTPPHRDRGSAPSDYDLLVSVGTHTEARIGLVDVRTTFSYCPGTVVLVCGRVILHEVSSWEGGERICVAHYVRDNVHNRLEVERPAWVLMRDFIQSMSKGYRSRQGI